jgi:hypothetical protein
MDKLKSLIDIAKDIMTHPEEDLPYIEALHNLDVFKEAEIEEIQSALSIILNNETLSEIKKMDYINNLWRVNYYERPPSIEDFLQPQWIGLTADSLFPYVREILTTYFSPNSDKRHLLLALAIGMGKSTLSVLAVLYISVLYNLLRDPKQFCKLAESAPVVVALLSFTQEKTNDILTKPLLNIISSCGRYERCKMESQLIKKQKDYGHAPGSRILFTTAGEGSVLRMGDLLFKQVSDKSALLGLNIISAVISEINFFVERGVSQEYINDLYWDLRGRIFSRLGNDNYLARTILDSSVSSFDNVIERYIWQESYKDPTNMFVHMTKWQGQPDLFPIWSKDNSKVFPVFSGSSAKQPKILALNELSLYDDTKIIYMPNDIRTLAEQSLLKTLKDYASVPAGTDAKLISNPDLIESMFTKSLRNFYMFERAPASLPPEGLLWPLVKDKFFVHTGRGNLYKFYRNPYADRFISIDLARVNDMAAISMCHLETNIKGEKIYVIDFTLPIKATKEDINMDAFKYLVSDMYTYGGIKVKVASYDMWQSDTSRDYLTRLGFEVIRYSVDSHPEAYLSFISYMAQGRIKMGKSLVMKNNMKSLISVKSKGGKFKIDKEKGSWIDLENENWETSRCGYYSNDLSDATVACCVLADMYGTLNADYLWDEKKEIERSENSKNVFLQDIKAKYNMKPYAKANA